MWHFSVRMRLGEIAGLTIVSPSGQAVEITGVRVAWAWRYLGQYSSNHWQHFEAPRSLWCWALRKWPWPNSCTNWRHAAAWLKLGQLPAGRYARAMRLWAALYGVRPRGLSIEDGKARLNFEPAEGRAA